MAEDKDTSGKIWHRVDAAGLRGVSFLKDGEVRELEIGGKLICIARSGDRCFAVNARCPHNGARMCNGFVEPGAIITCPLHRFRFSLENGKNVSGEGFFLATHPLELREEGMFVALPEKKGLLGWW